MIRRISVDTILNAKKGDESAIQTILNYYKGYMLELCKFELSMPAGKSMSVMMRTCIRNSSSS